MTNLMSNIRIRMTELGITQARLAELIDKPKGSVNGWFKRDLEPKTIDAVKIACALNTTVESLVSGDITIDPAEMYIKKDPALRSLVIKLGLHPELVPRVDAYLEGYMDSHGYGQEDVKKEA